MVKHQKQKVIKEFQNEHRWLSNFWLATQEMFGMTFCCNEQWYVYNKCTNDDDRIELLNLTKPGEIKRFGRKLKGDRLNPDFDKIKYGVMQVGLAAKFDQNPDLKEKILSTGNTILQEGNRWGDKYWGVNLNPTKGKIGAGENNLGKLLMKLRKEYMEDVKESEHQSWMDRSVPPLKGNKQNIHLYDGKIKDLF